MKCSTCPPNTRVQDGGVGCLACPVGEVPNLPGQSYCKICTRTIGLNVTCISGTKGLVENDATTPGSLRCASCTQLVCVESQSCQSSSKALRIKPGWNLAPVDVRSTSVAAIMQCPMGIDACRGFDVTNISAPVIEAHCNEGYTGALCGLCEAEWYIKGDRCTRCPTAKDAAYAGGMYALLASIVVLSFVCVHRQRLAVVALCTPVGHQEKLEEHLVLAAKITAKQDSAMIADEVPHGNTTNGTSSTFSNFAASMYMCFRVSGQTTRIVIALVQIVTQLR